MEEKSKTWTTEADVKSQTLSFPARRNVILSWIWEISAAFLSVGAMLSAIAVLARENKQPLAAWAFPTSLNTVVATLGTISRTTLAFAVSACIGQQKWNRVRHRSDSLLAFTIYDEASRGPWGSTRLVFLLRMRHWATMGALVLVGSLVFDPFLQAVISSDGRLDQVLPDSMTTVVRASSLDFKTAKPMSRWLSDNATIGNLSIMPVDILPTTNFAMASAIYNGFYNSSSSRNQTAAFQCATGNCTWFAFTSLAFCSSCVDVSHLIKNKSDPASVHTDYANTVYSLPYADIRNNDGRKGNQPYDRTVLSTNWTVRPEQTISFQEIDTMLIAFLTMLAAPSWRANQTNWNESTPSALECALTLCVNAYQSNVKNGVFTENIITSWSQRDPSSYQPTDDNSVNYTPAEVAALDDALGNSLYKVQDNFTVYRTDLRLATLPRESREAAGNVSYAFNITQLDILGMIGFLRSLGDDDLTWPQFYRRSNSGSLSEMLNDSTNLTTTFARVAESMTNHIRDMSGTPIQGTAYRWTPHVKVQWPFLTLPVIIVITGCLYVVLTIVESTRLDLPAWKESALPMLLYGFDDETRNLLRRAQDDPRAAKVSETVQIKFGEEGNGLRVVA